LARSPIGELDIPFASSRGCWRGRSQRDASGGSTAAPWRIVPSLRRIAVVAAGAGAWTRPLLLRSTAPTWRSVLLNVAMWSCTILLPAWIRAELKLASAPGICAPFAGEAARFVLPPARNEPRGWYGLKDGEPLSGPQFPLAWPPAGSHAKEGGDDGTVSA